MNCAKEADFAAEPFGYEAVVNPGPITDFSNAKLIGGSGDEHFLGSFKEEVHSLFPSSPDSFHHLFRGHETSVPASNSVSSGY